MCVDAFVCVVTTGIGNQPSSICWPSKSPDYQELHATSEFYEFYLTIKDRNEEESKKWTRVILFAFF